MDFNVRLVEGSADQWLSPVDTKYHTTYFKSAALLTSLATSVLASAYLAYSNPGKWWLMTSSVMVINFSMLPKILHYSHPSFIKISLAIHLTTLGSLTLGGISAYAIFLGPYTLNLLKNYQLSAFLSTAFFGTALLGYIAPLSYESLKKTYDFFNVPEEWQECFKQVSDQFRKSPEIGFGFLQTNLLQSFILYLSILKPNWVIDFFRLININPSPHVWSIIVSFGRRVTSDQLNRIISSMEQTANLAQLQRDFIPAEMIENFLLKVKLALKSMNPKDLPAAIRILLTNGSKLIPYVLSNEEFLAFFKEDALDATNALIQDFLVLTDSWKDVIHHYQKLNHDILQLEQEIQNQNISLLTSIQVEQLTQRHQQINQEFNKLRVKIEKTYSDKRIWQDFAPLWPKHTPLPFKNGQELLNILNNQTLLSSIDQLHRSMIGTGQGANRTLSDRLQYITNKLIVNRQDKEEESSAIIFLAEKKGFIQKDYENLQDWLNVDSLNDLEEAMEKIGLKTEKDLYKHHILSQSILGKNLSKSDICLNLRRYIEKNLKFKNIQPQSKIESLSRVHYLLEKVIRVVYYAISSGLILVPLFINPSAGAFGFSLGLCYFSLKRFNAPGTQTIADFTNSYFNHFILGRLLQNLLNRPIFHFPATRRASANHFVNTNFFAQMQIINLHVIYAIFISHLSLRFEPSVLGILCQGIALGKEAVDSI